MLEDPWFDAGGPEARGTYKLTVSPQDAPDESEYAELHLESGNCIFVAPGGADFADTIHMDIEKWWEPDSGKHLIDGLRKAGLEIAAAKGTEEHGA
jgi:hypothetical protein